MEVKGERTEDGKGMAGIYLENWNYLAGNMIKLKTENKYKCPLPVDQFAIPERRKRMEQSAFWAEERKNLGWKKL